MRIFAFSDYHNGNFTVGPGAVPWKHDAFTSRIREVNVDVIISIGDHTHFGDVDLEFYAPLREAVARGAKAFYVRGNHEDGASDLEFQEQVPGAINLDRRVEVVGGACFFGWNAFADTGRDCLIRAEARIHRLAEMVEETDARTRVLVSHEAPAEYMPPWGRPTHVGDRFVSLLMELTRATIVLVGHYHCDAPHEQVLKAAHGRVRIINPGPTGVVLEIGETNQDVRND